MAWRPHARVQVSARSPRAAGVCDRCGIPTNHYKLRWQFDWAGLRLQNLRVLVCDRCYDVPQRQLGAKILGPDPVPIFNARPEPFTISGFSYQESNILCAPSVPFPASFGSDFNADFNNDFGPGNENVGPDGDGPQLLAPDGATVLLMPNNPSGTSGSDFNADFNNDFGTSL
jgi:hypothetical protein